MIGCAKDMRSGTMASNMNATTPIFEKEASANALRMLCYDIEDMAKMLKCNIEIARENKLRYMRFHDADNKGQQAALAYDGIVFKYLSPESFSKEDAHVAQDKLWITSFLYGLLRPSDTIKPYRLEGSVKLEGKDKSMFDYWKPKLTNILSKAVKNDDGILLDLASNEMRKLFFWKEIEKDVNIIKPEFYVNKGGKLKTIVIYSKMCRGAMARFALTNRINSPEALKTFQFEGFSYSDQESKPGHPVFIAG